MSTLLISKIMAMYSTKDQYADQANVKWRRYNDSAADTQEFVYGEIAADNALDRSLYSARHMAEAQMEGLKNAGLSPSIYASGGVPSGSGASGLNGGGASTHSQQAEKMNAILNASMQAASFANQIAQVKAQIENTKADTALKKAQAGKTNVETEYQNYINQNQYGTNHILNSILINKETKEETSFFELAELSNSYKEFMGNIRKLDFKNVPYLQSAINTENGQRILRDIYINSKEQSANIAALNKQETNDELATKILNVLNEKDFAKLSADEQIEALKKSVESSKLDSQTNEAWNNLLNSLGEGTTQDIAIVMGLLLKTLIGRTSFSTSHTTVVK